MSKATGDWRLVRISGFVILSTFVIRISSFGFRHCAEPHVGCYRIMNDLKFAFRQLLKQPGFTAVAVLTLALGIGANTALFSVVNGVLLRPLPFHEQDRLVTLWESNPARGVEQQNVSPPNFAGWQAQSSTVD